MPLRDSDAEQEAAEEMIDLDLSSKSLSRGGNCLSNAPITHRTRSLREQKSAFAMNVPRGQEHQAHISLQTPDREPVEHHIKTVLLGRWHSGLSK